MPARRWLLLAGIAAIAWGTLGAATGNYRGVLVPFAFGPRRPFATLMAGAIVIGLHFAAAGWRGLNADVEWLLARLRPARVWIVVAASLFALAFGVRYGTYSATGSDSYGYISEAEGWRRGQLRVEQPFAADLPWPDVDTTLSPLAYRPAQGGHAIVPTVMPGLPLIMSLFLRVAGDCGAYYVGPLFGALAVWLCYRLGAKIESPGVGAGAAVLFAFSPIFLSQVIFPWTDVPSAACWTAVWVFVLDRTKASALMGGIAASLAIAIRPNLAPLIVMPAGFLIAHRGDWFRFLAAAAPGAIFIAAVNAHLYGSPLASGYGELGPAFAWSHGIVNAERYGSWLVEAHTLLIALAVVALARTGSATRGWMAAFAGGVVASYLFYIEFDKWAFVRFLLPALPMLLVLMVGCAAWIAAPLPRAVQTLVFGCGGLLLVGHQFYGAATTAAVFNWQPHEHRYTVVGRYIAEHTPARAIVVSMQHSGSIRFYSGRVTLRYDLLAPDWLDRAIAALRERGWRPYILLEEWEEAPFKARFAAANEAGRLSWPPIARSTETIPVALYEPPGSAAATPGATADMPWIADRWCRGAVR
jgi:hypothetical protein